MLLSALPLAGVVESMTGVTCPGLPAGAGSANPAPSLLLQDTATAGSGRRTRSPWITSWIASTQIQRQLLGAQSSPNGVYVPKDEDVPLRSWLVEQLGEEAVVEMDRGMV